MVVGKDENAVRQLVSMVSTDNHHVVCQAVVIFFLVLSFSDSS